MSEALLPLDEVRRRLSFSGQSYAGVRAIPVSRIVGSVDRSGDFGRDFRPRRPLSKARLARLRAAFRDGALPAIEVFEAGGAYFVSDGHHRVALARERGAEFVDAHVTRVGLAYEIDADTDVPRLAHTQQQARLLEESGLARAHPAARIVFSGLGGYPELLEIVKAHGYDLARRRGFMPSPEEMAADFHDRVYLPAVSAVRAEGLFDLHPDATEADLFLWVYQRRRALRAIDSEADWAAAARDARRRGVSRRFMREIRRERRPPLRRAEAA